MKRLRLFYAERGSLRSILRKSYTAIIVSLALPTAVLLVAMLLMTAQYSRLIENIDRAATLQDSLGTRMQGAAWDVVAGKQDFRTAALAPLLDEIAHGLDGLSTRTADRAQQSFIDAARRATDTLGTYVDTLRLQLEENAAVTYNEGVYRELCSVAQLTQDMLQQYIDSELAAVSHLRGQVGAAAVAVGALVLVLLGAVLWFTLVAYRGVQRRVHDELAALQRTTASIAAGDLGARAETPGLTELYGLAVSFNTMAGQLQQGIDRQLEAQELLRKSEMRALQAQITPHFVYNTFDTIVWLAEAGRNREVIDITMAFTEFFRISVSRGQDFISVAQEMRHVSSYLAIQSVRYGSILTYEVSIDPALHERPILKLLLQPLVENALYHGIKRKRGRGCIRVRGVPEADGAMTFSVEDDGAGMPAERLRQLTDRISRLRPSEDIGFGLFNVNQRLQLYYGARLFIESEAGRGTRIRFTVPRRSEGEPND